ncbi:receptor-like protein 1 [Quercus suber]|uniref:receptor-like protein 1 n=1 Tax=Quercus suber TaxID=58331 RepID=UPI0032DF9BC3
MGLLDVLDVSFKNFSREVPKELLAGCLKLLVLKLSKNNFQGHLFSSNFNLNNLEVLRINDNKFSGTLSNVLAKCSCSLSFLDVDNNNMVGKIISWICNQTKLALLLLRDNFFSGQISCETTSLIFLDLSHNPFSESLPSWSRKGSLNHIHLEENFFLGSIPKAFLNVSGLLSLDISHNKLSGKIPRAIGKLSSLKILLLRGNRLSGAIRTNLCQLVKINLMDLSSNFFFGSIPHCFQDITFGKNHSYEFSTNYVIIMTSTKCGSVSEDSMPLVVFDDYKSTEEVNFITKNLLISYKDNILNYMSGLDLSCNNLMGEIPLELGKLSSVRALNLSHNQLIGFIPQTF